MTTPIDTVNTVTLINVLAIEQQARAMRAQLLWEAFAGLSASFKLLIAKFRPQRQVATGSQPRTGAFA